MSEVAPTAAGGEPEGFGESGAASAAPERVCPNCGAALLDSRCKLVCPDRACGYFMSCSDFY
jgi:hypothetical protein